MTLTDGQLTVRLTRGVFRLEERAGHQLSGVLATRPLAQ
jgi:hypothetical protein